jgi:FMN phosphatase YigB (HAD superfamily)
MSKQLIIFLDSGDTIMNEATEVYEGNTELVLSVEVIPGADTMVKELHKRGFTLAIVADGLAQSFKNAFTQHDIYHCFTSLTYSEQVRALKPSPRMFKAAMGSLELTDEDCSRIIMVGNNLSRDIKGANLMGLTSVHMSWTSRYSKTPADETEIPDYTIATPMDLIELAEELTAKLEQGIPIKPAK